uniref:Uncharacterized protein n=1 Tax=Anguilla anguilla TaxID=7936 RepID=A0A0E9WPV5_ANGAN
MGRSLGEPHMAKELVAHLFVVVVCFHCYYYYHFVKGKAHSVPLRFMGFLKTSSDSLYKKKRLSLFLLLFKMMKIASFLYSGPSSCTGKQSH